MALAQPQAITTFCTNLRAAPLAERVEAELGIPLLDTVSTTVWGPLRAVGADPSRVRGWGMQTRSAATHWPPPTTRRVPLKAEKRPQAGR